MTTVFSGALAPKKKQELVQLANALSIDEAGTKEALSERIKDHLANNQHLAKDERFTGLYGKQRKASTRLAVKYVYAIVIGTEEVGLMSAWTILAGSPLNNPRTLRLLQKSTPPLRSLPLP